MTLVKYVWFNGEIVKWEDAKVHVMTHAIHYGTSIFEGVRGYWNGKNLLVFRLEDHIRRMFDSAKILGMNIPYTPQELHKAVVETLRVNEIREDVYIRPVAFVSTPTIVLDIRKLDTSLAIIVMPFGKYLKPDGIRATIVSWRRVHNTMLPVMAKIGGIYVNSVLALVEARSRGFDEALLMDSSGHVVEGSGENIFIVKRGRLYTPPTYASILEGITRDTVLKLASDLKIEVVERPLTREDVYTADEVFLVGTAAEITPVVEVDYRPIGDGKPGPITTSLSETYGKIVRGAVEKYLHWITPVY